MTEPRNPLVSPTHPRRKSILRLQWLSQLLDNAIAIPGTRYRIGLDPILGLLPAGGDIVTALLSGYIVWEAAQLGVPQDKLGQMVTNIVLDALAGTIPVLGDLFDVTWKANVKNMELIEEHLQVAQPGRKVSQSFVILMLLGLLLMAIAISIGSIWIIRLVFQALGF